MANLRANNLCGTGGRTALDGSVFFDGNGRLSVPNSADVRVGSDDFTIEAWIRAENPGDWTTVLGMWDSSATRRTYALQRKKADSKLYFYVSADGGSTVSATATQFASGGDITLGEWHHVAGVRDGNTIRAYLNGVQVGNASFTASILNNTTDALFIGDTEVTAGGEAFNGYMSNVRMVKGTCLYPSGITFTPPTEKLTAVDGTVLLCCQDSDDPTQEATGKTITGDGGLDINETEYVTNGTFAGGTYSPAWTAWGNTTTAQSGGIFIERTSTLTGVYQQLPTDSMQAGQYKLRGQISNKTGPGGAMIRLSSASQGNGTSWFGGYASPATSEVIEHTFTYSGSGGLYVNLMIGNNTGSADFSNISFRQVYTADGAPKVTPPVGVDGGVVFDGETKHNTQSYMYFPTGDTSQRGRGRGLLMGGAVSPGATNTTQIKYFDIASQGITDDFGQTSVARRATGSLSSSTRAVMGGGFVSPPSPYTISDVMDYVTIATTANATDFGNMQSTGYSYGTASNETRGLFAGGYRPNNSAVVDTIDLITIATTANATDFGNLVVARRGYGGLASPTRGIFMGGAPSTKEELDYVTIATTGNATDFGNLTDGRDNVYGGSSSTRGVMGGGRTPSNTNIIDYITIATTGNATDFGDLLSATFYNAATSNSSRLVWVGNTGITNTMEYVTIATTGNSIDWGDQGGTTQHSGGACSDSHGGIS